MGDESKEGEREIKRKKTQGVFHRKEIKGRQKGQRKQQRGFKVGKRGKMKRRWPFCLTGKCVIKGNFTRLSS